MSTTITTHEPARGSMIFPRPEYDRNVAAALSSARAWYGNALPRKIESPAFVDFVARSWDFARVITDKAQMQIRRDFSSAATDGVAIFLPGNYFKQGFYEEMVEVSDFVAAAVMCVNGSQIHEALHIALSTCRLPEWAATNPEANKLFNEHIGFGVVLNVVEDIFIEAYGRKQWSFLDMFVEGKNDVLFGELVIWERMNALYGEDATQDDLLNALVVLKNVHHRQDTRWSPWQKIVDELLSANDPDLSKDERLQIAINVWKLLATATDASGQPLPEGEASKRSIDRASASLGGALAPEEADALIKALLALAGSESDVEGESGSGKPSGKLIIEPWTFGSSGSDKLDQVLQVAFAEVNYTSKGDDVEIENQYAIVIENQKIARGEGKVNISRIPPVLVLNIMDKAGKLGSSLLTPSPDFRRLGHFLRYMREEKHHPGQPRTSGSQLVKTRLHRIVTDSKIMAFHDSKRAKRGKPEVIILVDMSGSMEHDRLIHKVAAAAYGAYDSLVACRVPVAVYGHTSVSASGRYQPLVLGIAAYEMPFLNSQLTVTNKPAEAFSMIPVVPHFQNFDGIAIREVAKRFSDRPGAKVLIVLSDGQPFGGSEYSGDSAVKHTSQVIIGVNRSGVSVISLSLTSEVMEANDKLYGKGNMPAYGGLLERSLQNLVRVIATGQSLT